MRRRALHDQHAEHAAEVDQRDAKKGWVRGIAQCGEVAVSGIFRRGCKVNWLQPFGNVAEEPVLTVNAEDA